MNRKPKTSSALEKVYDGEEEDLKQDQSKKLEKLNSYYKSEEERKEEDKEEKEKGESTEERIYGSFKDMVEGSDKSKDEEKRMKRSIAVGVRG